MKRNIIALSFNQAIAYLSQQPVVNTAQLPTQGIVAGTNNQISSTVNTESTAMAKTSKIHLVLIHVELEKDCPTLEKLVASRVHTIDGVALATPVTVAGDSFVVELPGGAVFTCASLEDLRNVSFK